MGIFDFFKKYGVGNWKYFSDTGELIKEEKYEDGE
jgi:hypothetical protein